MIYVYRFPQLAYSIRNYKFYNEKGTLLNYATSDSEVIIKEELKKLTVKVDYLSGSFEVNEKKDLYLICYYSPNSFWSAFLPNRFRNYFQFEALSKEEYSKVLQTKKFGPLQTPLVSVEKAQVSRILSLLFIVLGVVAFYFTDFKMKGIGENESTRLLSLVLVLTGTVGVIWNYNKFANIYLQAIGLVVISLFFMFDVLGTLHFTSIFSIPILGAFATVLFFFFYNRKTVA